jgi:endonuclease/exonuclease/phosphatase family metal-dependent hydrolase
LGHAAELTFVDGTRDGMTEPATRRTPPQAEDRSGAGLHADRRSGEPPLSLLALVALLTVASLELIRSSGPLLTMAFEVSVTVVAVAAVAVYSGIGVFVLALLRATPGSHSRAALATGVGVLTAARLVVQGLDGWVRFGVGLAAVALAVAVLILGVDAVAGYRLGGPAAAAAMACGAAAGVGIQLALGTWDAYWRHSSIGWGVTGVLLAPMVACALAVWRGTAPPSAPTARRGWVVGPALAVTVMMLANAGFASTQSEVRLVVAGPIAAVGWLLAAALASLAARGEAGSSPRYRQAMSVAALALAAAVAGVLWANGPAVLVLLVVAQVGLVAVLARALQPTGPSGREASPSPVRAAGRASIVGLGTILPLLIFQLDYDIPLGFPNELVIVAAAAVLTAAVPLRRGEGPVVGRDTGRDRGRARASRPLAGLLVLGGAVVLTGTAIAVARTASTDPPAAASPPTGPVTLVSWNLHFGVDPDGDVDLEQIARSIEEQDPSVITLQEVSRGWVMAAGTDMATWLAERLEMRMVFSPAADRRFGNAILTDLGMENVTRLELPYGEGPQNRSAISGDLIVADGPVRVTSVHLQSSDSTATRFVQVDTLLEAEGGAPRAVIAGDFNAEPGGPEIDRMIAAGLVSAQDVAGDPSEMTSTSTDPRRRIDWVFGRGVTFTDARVLGGALSSDHLPLVVTFAPAADQGS